MLKKIITFLLFSPNLYAVDLVNKTANCQQCTQQLSLQNVQKTCPAQPNIQKICPYHEKNVEKNVQATCPDSSKCENSFHDVYNGKESIMKLDSVLEKEFDGAFYLNLAGVDIFGPQLTYFLNQNFAISISAGFFPDIDNEQGDPGFFTFTARFAYFINLNSNNKFYLGIADTNIVAPSLFFGYEHVNKTGFSIKLGGYVVLYENFYKEIPVVPCLSIGSRF